MQVRAGARLAIWASQHSMMIQRAIGRQPEHAVSRLQFID